MKHRKALMEFFRLQSERYYPGELISHLYMMMGMHLLIGTQAFLDLIRFMIDDIKTFRNLKEEDPLDPSASFLSGNASELF